MSRRVADAARQDRGGRSSPYVRSSSQSSRPASDDRWQHDLFEGKSERGTGGERGFRRSHDPTPNLIVEGLHWEVTEAELQDLFEKIGPLHKLFLKYDRSGRSTGVAIVHYSSARDAEAAREEYDGANAKGQPITISYEQVRPPRAPAGRAGDAGSADLRSRMDLLSRMGTDRAPANAPRGPASSTSSRPSAPLRTNSNGLRTVSGNGSGSRGQGGRSRGGRGPGAGGRGGEGRERPTAKTASDLDAELEAFMSAPSGAAATSGDNQTAPPDGDVEMK